MVTPAGDLQPVVPPSRRQSAHLLERQIGPLAGEQGDWFGHRRFLFPWVVYRPGISCQESVSEAGFHGCQDALDLREPSAKDGQGSSARGDVSDEVDDLVRESVLITDEVPRWPPGSNVRVDSLGHHDAPEAGRGGRLVAVEEVEKVRTPWLRTPVLLVHGGEDRVTPLRTAALPLLELLPDVRLHVLERCGHVPAVEHPTRLPSPAARLPLPELSPGGHRLRAPALRER